MAVSTQVGSQWDLSLAGYSRDRSRLDDAEWIRGLLSALAVELGMTIVNGPTTVSFKEMSRDPEAGLSGFVIIAESHIAIHTWPREGYFSLQVSSCKEFDPVHARRIVTGRLMVGRKARDDFVAWREGE